jgi:hypothetical protein
MKADQQKRTLPDKKLRVLAADDHDAVLQHVVSLLELECSNGEERSGRD